MKIRRRGYPAESRTFETKAAAERYARGIESEMDNGTFVSRAEAESTTLAELLERYLAEVTTCKKGAEPETYRIRALLRHPLASRIVATIRSADIAAYRDERLADVTPGSVKRELVILGHLFEIARKDWGIHVDNPVRLVRPPASPKPTVRRATRGIRTAPPAARAAAPRPLWPRVWFRSRTRSTAADRSAFRRATADWSG